MNPLSKTARTARLLSMAGPAPLTNAFKRRTVAAGICLGLGVVSLAVAVTASKLWPVLIGAVLGIVLIAASLLWVNDELGEWFGDEPPGWLKLVFTAILALGLILIWVAAAANNEIVGVFATVIIAAAVIGWHTIRRTEHADPGPIHEALWQPLELVVGGVLAVWALDGFSTWAWGGLIVAFYGLIEIKQAMASLVADGRINTKPVLRWSIDITVVGILAVLAGASTSSQLPLLTGAAAAFGGLSVLGLTLVQMPCSRAKGVLQAGIGVFILALGWWRAIAALGSYGPAAVLVVFIAIIGAWFIWRGEGVILVVLIGFIAVWGMTDPSSSAPLDPNPNSETRILALGDSYISGEGADEYFPGTNQVGNNRNECRRAPTAHPYLVAESMDASLTFVACSGAKAVDLTRCGQMASGDGRCREPYEWTDADREESNPVAGRLPQLANFTTSELQDFDVVLLSIGGNDVGFSTIVQACLLPRSCNERAETWLGNIAALGPILVDTYTTIREAVGPETLVVVVPYPLVLDAEPCNLGLDRGEHEFVQTFANRLDDQIEQSATAAGMVVYKPARNAFARYRLCDSSSAVNHITLDPAGGTPSTRYLPSAWIHGSMHPNELGHQLLACGAVTVCSGGLASFVVAQLSGVDISEPVNNEVNETVDDEAAAATVDAVTADDLLTDGQWISDELYRTVRALLVPIVLVLAGSFVLALGLANVETAPFRLLRPRRTWRDRQ